MIPTANNPTEQSLDKRFKELVKTDPKKESILKQLGDIVFDPKGSVSRIRNAVTAFEQAYIQRRTSHNTQMNAQGHDIMRLAPRDAPEQSLDELFHMVIQKDPENKSVMERMIPCMYEHCQWCT